MTHAGTPHENPFAEQFMCGLGDALTAYANAKESNWDKLLPAVMFAYRARVHTAVGDSPFHALLSWDPRMPADLEAGALREIRGNNDDTSLADHIAMVLERLQQCMTETAVV